MNITKSIHIQYHLCNPELTPCKQGPHSSWSQCLYLLSEKRVTAKCFSQHNVTVNLPWISRFKKVCHDFSLFGRDFV